MTHERSTRASLNIMRDRIDNASTAYGDISTVNRDARFVVSSEYPLTEQRDLYTDGITRIDSDAEFRLRANNEVTQMETVDRLAYTPGYIAEIGIAIRIPTAPTGEQEIRWGYWDGDNGIYFGWDSEGVFIEQMRNGVRQGKRREADWNKGEHIDAAKELQRGTITRKVLGLYNYGFTEGQIYKSSDGDILRSENELAQHVVDRQASENQTTLASQNLPIRVEVDNSNSTSDFDVYVADRQAAIRGQFTPSRRVNGERDADITLSGTTWEPFLSIRKKADFSQVDVDILDFSMLPDENVFVQLRSGVGSTTAADYSTPSNIDAGETAIETDTTPGTLSINDGNYRYQNVFSGGSRSGEELGTFEEVDTSLRRTEPLTLFARTTGAKNGTIDGYSLNWKESW